VCSRAWRRRLLEECARFTIQDAVALLDHGAADDQLVDQAGFIFSNHVDDAGAAAGDATEARPDSCQLDRRNVGHLN
jgi:hypothetical protein